MYFCNIIFWLYKHFYPSYIRCWCFVKNIYWYAMHMRENESPFHSSVWYFTLNLTPITHGSNNAWRTTFFPRRSTSWCTICSAWLSCSSCPSLSSSSHSHWSSTNSISDHVQLTVSTPSQQDCTGILLLT